MRLELRARWSFHNHYAVVTNPNVGPFFLTNFNDSQRDILGAFVERSLVIGETMGLDAGVRYNRVTMNTGEVGSNESHEHACGHAGNDE